MLTALIALAACGADKSADRLLSPPGRAENINNVTSIGRGSFDSHDVTVGQTENLNIFTYGAQGVETFCGGQVTWTSSNTAVGTVAVNDMTNSCSLTTSQAVFQAVGVGSTVVTANANGRTLTATITVKAPPPLITSSTAPTINGPGTYTWSAIVYPCLTDCSVVWTRTNRGVTTTIQTESAIYTTAVQQTLVAEDYGTIRVTASRNGQTTSTKEWAYDLRTVAPAIVASFTNPVISGPGTYTWTANFTSCSSGCTVKWFNPNGSSPVKTEVNVASSSYTRSLSSTDRGQLRVVLTKSGLPLGPFHFKEWAYDVAQPGVSTDCGIDIDCYPPAPLPVLQLSGPSAIGSSGTYTWTMSVSGGAGSPEYDWLASYNNGNDEIYPGQTNAPQFTTFIDKSIGDFEIWATVYIGGKMYQRVMHVIINNP